MSEKINTPSIINTNLGSFAIDVVNGLKAEPKSIPSRCFYNAEGCRLFKQIMQLPEYYLTAAEYQTLDENKMLITEYLSQFKNFNLIDFGAGDGLKTKLLLRTLQAEYLDFTYYPVDISIDSLNDLETSLKSGFPELKYEFLNMDYFDALQKLRDIQKDARSIILFLGSNIGNFEPADALDFLKKLRSSINNDDLCLIGFDMIKNPFIIKKAYDDNKGITRSFNLNLLERMNKELGADFDLDQFEHYPEYSPLTGAARSYLISLQKQTVHFDNLNQSFSFKKGEAIHTEISQKFSNEMIKGLSVKSGFKI